MKNAVVALCLIINVLCVNVYAEVYTRPTTLKHQTIHLLTIIGSANLENITTKILSVTGPMKATDLTTQLLTVTGPSKVSNSEVVSATITGPADFTKVTILKSLKVTGPANLNHVSVAEELKITGPLDIKNSVLNQLRVAGDEVKLHNTTATQLFIKHNYKGKQQVVVLSGKSKIKHIHFDSGSGKVIIIGSSANVETIAGGKCIKRQRK